MKKHEKNSWKITIFHFLENCNFPRFFFKSFFIIFASSGKFDEKWKKRMKNDKTMNKNERNSGKIVIFHFLDFFSPLEAKMMKNDRKMIEKWKKWKTWKKQWKNEKKEKQWKKNKKMKKPEENCNFLFFSLVYHFSSFFNIFHQFHHWKQKWLKKNEENCNFPKNEKLQFSSSFFMFFFIFFIFFFLFFIFLFFSFVFFIFFIFLSFFIIFASSGANFSKKRKIAIFLDFFHLFSFVYHFLYHFHFFLIIFHQFHHWKHKW